MDSQVDDVDELIGEDPVMLHDKVDCLTLKCPACSKDFSEDRVPRNLQCGHSLCTPCAGDCVAGQKLCPECSEKQHVKKFTEFPVNYPLLRLMRYFANKEVDVSDVRVPTFLADVPSSDKQQEVWKCGAHGNSKLFLCCSCSVWVCQDCLIVDHPFLPRGKCRVLRLADAITKVRNELQKLANLILKDIKNMRASFELQNIVYEYCRNNCPESNVSLDRFIWRMETQVKEAEKDNVSVVEQEMERLKKLTEAVNTTSSPEEMTRLCKELVDYKDELKEVSAKEKKRNMLVSQSVLDILRKKLKIMVEGKVPVYAVLDEEGGSRWGLFTIKKERLLLYSLNEGRPPKESITIPFEYVKVLLPNEKRTVFFDVGTAEENLGQVYVHLEGDNPLTRQFVMLCSAEKGVSYKNTCFYKFDNSKNVLEGGDYENNDGTGGRPIVEDIGDWETSSVLRSGHGHLVTNIENTRFQFHLGSRSIRVIGRVSQLGLEVLRPLRGYNPVSTTMIRECGLFIPMNVKSLE